jgi:hypothetical protein
MRYILLSFFRVLIRRLYRPHELREICRLRDAYRSGSFIGISFVFITGLDARTTFKFHHNDDEEVKETRGEQKALLLERSQRVKKGAHKRTVCVRCSNERVVVSIRRRERCVHGA